MKTEANTAITNPTSTPSSLCNTDHNPKISNRPNGWPVEHFDLLKKCWAEMLSAQISADQLNSEFGTSYTRSAVISQVRRHDLSAAYGRVKAKPLIAKPYPTPRRRAVQTKAPQKYKDAPMIDDALIPFEQRKTLMELDSDTCRWPVGDPATPDFFYCGAKALATSPYCAGHCKRAFGYVSEARSNTRRQGMVPR